tara:strand:+ start:16143 stop:16448 length:306 start_codon:yes stop_codon:yes gene_type:complete
MPRGTRNDSGSFAGDSSSDTVDQGQVLEAKAQRLRGMRMSYSYGAPFRIECKAHGITGLARTSKWGGVTVVWDHWPNREFHYPRDLMNRYFMNPEFWTCCY